jgi:CheY-like chemotaxis protein
MKVLLVEDNEMNREIAEEILTENGLIVDTATDGDIAVDKVRKAAPGDYELILMDVQMPRMNGYDATKAIRKLEDSQKSRIPIIAMTANAFEEDKKNALDAGMNGHLAKPIEVQKLIQMLTNFRQS